jgi:hypothetical protein
MAFKTEWLDWKAGFGTSGTALEGRMDSSIKERNTFKENTYDKTTETYRQTSAKSDKSPQRSTGTPIQVTAKSAKTPELVYFEDESGRWYKSGEKYWHVDKTTDERTELVPGKLPENDPIPVGVWDAFGKLLAYVIKRRTM